MEKNNKKYFKEDLGKKFCGGDIYKFCLMLRKGVYHYEFMDSWKRFN